MYFIFTLIWMLGVTSYIDEMTMNFKSHHADKITMAYTAEGDGLYPYPCCQKEYTYQIFT